MVTSSAKEKNSFGNFGEVLRWWVITGLFLQIVLFSPSSASLSPVVTAKAGSFQGLQVRPPGRELSVYAFVGIPYAKAPTGQQRFNKPVPADPIPGIYNATTKPPSCFQLEFDLKFHWAAQNLTMSEDCLFLNVWTPESISTEKLKPVIAWIHGGAFTSGSTAMDIYDGQVLSALGQVVVVTVNYRLGPFGFLNSLTDDIPGNGGLHDQLLALKWIQINIKYFGGDPKRVTLSGESAGAMSAGLIALSPLARGLFHRVILQSGSSYAPPGTSPASSVESSNLLATCVGCANDTFTLFTNPKEVLSCLRSVTAEDLTKTCYRQRDSKLEAVTIYYRPTFWDDIIPKHPIDIFLSKNYSTYDALAGVTFNEGLPIFPYFFPDIYQQHTEGNLVLTKTLAASMLSGVMKNYGLAQPQKVVDYYLKDIGEDEQSVLKAIYNGFGDPIITCPTVYFADRYSEKNTPVFFYRFDHTPSTSPWPKSMGAAHFDEVQFVFGLPIRYPERYQKEEKALSEYMVRIWTDFVKSENLLLKDGSQWPNYSRSKPDFATLQTGEQATGSAVRKEACEFWRPFFDA